MKSVVEPLLNGIGSVISDIPYILFLLFIELFHVHCFSNQEHITFFPSTATACDVMD